MLYDDKGWEGDIDKLFESFIVCIKLYNYLYV